MRHQRATAIITHHGKVLVYSVITNW